jgi:hypothetical protein
MFYDEGSKRFMTTEPVELDRNPIVLSQTVSNEVDSVMSDAGTSESDFDVTQYTPSESSAISAVEAASFTPRTASITRSESLGDPTAFTRASTPREVRVEDRPTLPTTPSAVLIEGGIEDVPMVDVSPGKDQRVGDPSVRGTRYLARWPRDTVFEPGSSLPTQLLAPKSESSGQCHEYFAGYESQDECRTYKP